MQKKSFENLSAAWVAWGKTVQKRKIDQTILCHLERLLKQAPKEYIVETEFRQKLEKTLLYPTDDVLLYRDQFEALMQTALQTSKEVYLLSEGYDETFENGELFVLTDLRDYEAYAKLNIRTLNVMFAPSDDWIMLIEESLEGGIAVLAGTKRFIDQFRTFYGKGESDLRDYVEFCIREHLTRNVPLTQLTQILKMLY